MVDMMVHWSVEKRVASWVAMKADLTAVHLVVLKVGSMAHWLAVTKAVPKAVRLVVQRAQWMVGTWVA